MKYNCDLDLDKFISSKDIELLNFENNEFLKLFSKMTLIRKAEYKIANGRKNGLVGGPVHLGVGQEAIPVGISKYLNSKDIVFGAHRSHSHIISLGIDMRKFFAEILAKSTGVSKGMGGSMHLFDASIGFFGAVPIVAGTVPIAVGTALASNLKKERRISIVFLGDGAIEEGVVHESLNLARLNQCPIIFVVENNQFSSHLNINLRQPKVLTSRFAFANDIEASVVDGNNVMEICTVASNYTERIRNGQGPFFIEAITYRWFGHVDWREDIDVGVNRSYDDLNAWKKRDPILRFKNSLIKRTNISEDNLKMIENSIQNQVDAAWEEALNDPPPNWDQSKSYVFYD